MKTETEFRSPKVGGYFATMVKHFSQKIAVEATEDRATLRFVCGRADITLDQEVMQILVEGETQELLEMTCDVVERHLLRFAHREAPAALTWRPLT